MLEIKRVLIVDHLQQMLQRRIARGEVLRPSLDIVVLTCDVNGVPDHVHLPRELVVLGLRVKQAVFLAMPGEAVHMHFVGVEVTRIAGFHLRLGGTGSQFCGLAAGTASCHREQHVKIVVRLHGRHSLNGLVVVFSLEGGVVSRCKEHFVTLKRIKHAVGVHLFVSATVLAVCELTFHALTLAYNYIAFNP